MNWELANKSLYVIRIHMLCIRIHLFPYSKRKHIKINDKRK